MALIEAGDLIQALAAFRQAAKLNPDDPQLQMGVANCLAMQGELREAETQLRKLTQRHPGFALAQFNLANAVRDQGRMEEAVALYRRAVQLDSNLVDGHINLGGVLHAQEKLEEAEQAYRTALKHRPDYIPACCNLASVLIDLGRFAEAEAISREALARAPDSALLNSVLGAAIGHQGRLLEALEFHRSAQTLDPQNARALSAYGSSLYEVGRATEALPLLERGLAIDPDSPHVHHFLATAHLALGEFQEGWREYVHRPFRQRFIKMNPGLKLAEALPQSLAGNHVCVLREQGLGDELFFLRFAAMTKPRGAAVTYRANAKIAGLLSRVPVLDRVIPDSDPIPEADHTLLVGDLPHVLGRTESSPFKARIIARRTRPGSVGAFVQSLSRAVRVAYPRLPPPFALTPLATQLDALRRRLAESGPPPYIGITWRGGTAPEEQRGAFWVLFKQIPLERLGNVLRPINGTLLAFQRKPKPGEIEQLAACVGRQVHDLTALNEDLEAMLALLALADEYVGVSNTNMHLRAGVGKTARVLVPCPAEWRWMARGNESPWFPGFRIYRQRPDGDWSQAIDKLRDDLLATFGPVAPPRG